MHDRKNMEAKLVKVRLLPSASWMLLLLLLVVNSALAQESGKASAGASVFKSKCALCHGADGAGNTSLGKQLQAADLRSKDVQKRTNAELTKIVHDGQANMPPFADQLSDAEISHVIQYVRQLGKTKK